MFEREERKVVFDQIAVAYDAIRPGYPDALINNALACVGVEHRSRILEVGCGSGQATRSLAGRGFDVTCIDISPALLEIARENFRDDESFRFICTSFEDFESTEGRFDLVLAASSWHWTDPAVRYDRLSRFLKTDGCLIVMANLVPRRPLGGFDERVQLVYREVAPEWGHPDLARTTTDLIREGRIDMESSGFFTEVTVLRERWKRRYSREEYCALLGTYSDHHRLGAARLGHLLQGIGRIIDEEYGGAVLKSYEAVAYIGKR